MEEVRELLVRNAQLETELRFVKEQLTQAHNANHYLLDRLSNSHIHQSSHTKTGLEVQHEHVLQENIELKAMLRLNSRQTEPVSISHKFLRDTHADSTKSEKNFNDRSEAEHEDLITLEQGEEQRTAQVNIDADQDDKVPLTPRPRSSAKSTYQHLKGHDANIESHKSAAPAPGRAVVPRYSPIGQNERSRMLGMAQYLEDDTEEQRFRKWAKLSRDYVQRPVQEYEQYWQDIILPLYRKHQMATYGGQNRETKQDCDVFTSPGGSIAAVPGQDSINTIQETTDDDESPLPVKTSKQSASHGDRAGESRDGRKAQMPTTPVSGFVAELARQETCDIAKQGGQQDSHRRDSVLDQSLEIDDGPIIPSPKHEASPAITPHHSSRKEDGNEADLAFPAVQTKDEESQRCSSTTSLQAPLHLPPLQPQNLIIEEISPSAPQEGNVQDTLAPRFQGSLERRGRNDYNRNHPRGGSRYAQKPGDLFNMPAEDDPHRLRTVLVSNIPIGINLRQVLDVVHGGRVAKALLLENSRLKTIPLSTANSAMITFVNGYSAQRFVVSCTNHPILFPSELSGEPIQASVELMRTPSQCLPTSVINDDMSRVIYLHHPTQKPSPDLVLGQLHHEIFQWPPKIPLSYGYDKDSLLYFEFTNIADAKTAFDTVRARRCFAGVSSGFLPDPCERKFEDGNGIESEKNAERTDGGHHGELASDHGEATIGPE